MHAAERRDDALLTIAAGTQLTRAHLRRWAEALGRNTRPEILPENVLIAHADMLAWWVPQQVRPAHFALSLPPAGFRILADRVTVPYPIRRTCSDGASPSGQGWLPTIIDAFPELTDKSIIGDDAPSCSVAAALDRQSLFVNRIGASYALGMLFDLLGHGSIGYAGAFINLVSGQAVSIPL